MDLSIIIVTYNSEKYIEMCISSIFEYTTDIRFEIIVVDNSSTDNTVAKINTLSRTYRNITILNSENKGFSYGNNKGIRVAKGKYICLLNPDTILMNNAFKILVHELESDQSLGMVGAKLYDINNEPNLTFGSFPSLYETLVRTTKLRPYSYYFAKTNKRKLIVPYPSGADFVFRKELIESIGYMDENYFLYYDETDYALRIKKLGYRACILTAAKIIHLQGKSTEEVSEFAQTKFLESYVYYNIKNLSKLEAVLICNLKILEFHIKSFIKRKTYDKDIKFYTNAKLFIIRGKLA